MTTIQRLRIATSLALLALIVMGLPALPGAQQTCQPDGDIDQNGSVTAADALLAFQQALESSPTRYVSTDHSGCISPTGHTRRQHHRLGRLVHFPEGPCFAVLLGHLAT